VVSPSLPKMRSRPRLANHFSSEVSSWFIDDSFKETSFVSSSSFIAAVVIVREPQPLPRRQGFSLLLQLALAVIVVGCHSLEKREFRERESDQLDEREQSATLAYIATISGIFEEMPQSWVTVLQIQSSNGPKTSYPLLY
jgi:hypothetical protein